MPKTTSIEQTKRLMGALLRMPPKPHSEMKIGKSRVKKNAPINKKTRGASAKQ